MTLIVKICFFITLIWIILWMYGMNDAMKSRDNKLIYIQFIGGIILLYVLFAIYESY